MEAGGYTRPQIDSSLIVNQSAYTVARSGPASPHAGYSRFCGGPPWSSKQANQRAKRKGHCEKHKKNNDAENENWHRPNSFVASIKNETSAGGFRPIPQSNPHSNPCVRNEHPEGGRLVRISPLHRNRDIFLSARRHSFALQSSRNTMGATTSTQPPLATTPFPPTQATAAPPLKQAASTEEGDGGGSSSFLSADSPDDSDHHLYHLKFPHRQEDGWHSFVPFADAHQHHHGPLASPPAIKH
jgi:hypothetical protein